MKQPTLNNNLPPQKISNELPSSLHSQSKVFCKLSQVESNLLSFTRAFGNYQALRSITLQFVALAGVREGPMQLITQCSLPRRFGRKYGLNTCVQKRYLCTPYGPSILSEKGRGCKRYHFSSEREKSNVAVCSKASTKEFANKYLCFLKYFFLGFIVIFAC